MPDTAPSPGKWGDLGTRIASAVVMLAVTIGALWAGGLVWAALVVIVAVLMGWELAPLCEPGVDRVRRAVLALAFAVPLVLYVPVSYSVDAGNAPGMLGLVSRIVILLPPLLGGALLREARMIWAGYSLMVVLGALFFLAGMPWLWIGGLGALAVTGLGAAYTFFPHVAGRIDRFLSGEGDNYQVETGREAIINGGWLGQGPGEGTVKNIIPDSHADFPFAVAAEEFGIIACILLVSLFAFIVLRGLNHAMKEKDPYVRLAVSGLVTLFAIQSMINMMVNLQLMPAKGMTLPFISYGGSSMISMAICMGFVLALTRKRPDKLGSLPYGFTMRAWRPAE